MSTKVWNPKRLTRDENGQWWYEAGKNRRRQRAAPPRPCVRCQDEFVSTNSAARFCSHRCAMLTYHDQRIQPVVELKAPDSLHVDGTRSRFSQDASGQWWYSTGRYRLKTVVRTCVHCGCEFLAAHNRPNRQTSYCSRKCGVLAAYEKLPADKRTFENARAYQGGRTYRNGYVLALAPGHPALKNTKRLYVLEHRLVMEKELGRYLEAHERVHHKNGIRDDNRPENLELCMTSTHPPGQRAHERQHCATCTCFAVTKNA